MKRDLLIVPILLSPFAVWRADKEYHALRARHFAKEFLAVNSAWLTPNPPAMTYKVTSHHGQIFPASMQTWYSPVGNVRILRSTEGSGTNCQKDERYANGKGAVVHYDREDWIPKLDLASRITAQTGFPLITSLHVFAVNGVPWQTAMEDVGDTVILRWHGYRDGDIWFPCEEDYDMQLVVDRRTKLPIRMKEYREGVLSGGPV